MYSIIPCPLCVDGSGKSKGHSGPHRLFIDKERGKRRQQVYKPLLRAIPGMSTILGGKQWSYSEYSIKEAINIYIHFLDVCIRKHPVDIKKIVRQCKKCGSDISYLKNERFIWNYDQNKGCYHCDDIQ